jgi:hypothetical protein
MTARITADDIHTFAEKHYGLKLMPWQVDFIRCCWDSRESGVLHPMVMPRRPGPVTTRHIANALLQAHSRI